MTLLQLKEYMGNREFKQFLAMVLHAEGKVLPLETPKSRFDYGIWQVYCGNTTYDFSTCWKDRKKFVGNIHIYKDDSVKHVDINGGTAALPCHNAEIYDKAGHLIGKTIWKEC